MGRKKEATAEKDQSAIQQTEENSGRMLRPGTSISAEDPSPSMEQRLQKARQEKENWQAMRRKAVKLVEAIVEGHRDFDIELGNWKKFAFDNPGAWNDLLAVFLPGVSQEERKEFQRHLMCNGRAYQIVKSEADAAFHLGVAIGKRKSSSPRNKNQL